MSFRRGLKPSTPSKVAHRLGGRAHPLIGAQLTAGIRGSADLSARFPGFDQGQTETCHAHSASMLLIIAIPTLPFEPSPLLIASTTYADVRAAQYPSGNLPVLQDTGAELQDDANAMATWGVGPIGPDVQGRHSDVPNDDGYGFPEPDKSKLLVAGADLIGGEYSIEVTPGCAEVVAASLDVGIPVWTGGLVGAAYEALTASQVADPTPSDDATAGGHAQGAIGYRTAPGGNLEFLIGNSWGRGWCFNGMCWVSSAWIESMWDLWPFTAKVNP